MDIQSLGRTGHLFTNWATTYSCQPELHFEPETEEQLKQILNTAQIKNKKVKVVGCGHSFSDLVCTTDYMISMKNFDRVISIDKEACKIKVQAGIEVKKLKDEILPQHGLAFSVLGSVSEVSLAGCICTGTHGTGGNYGVLSSYVLGLEIMTANGEIIECSKEKNQEVFLAACCSLGALGVIMSVTFQCEPAFHLHQSQYRDTLNNPICRKDSWFWNYAVGCHMLQFCLLISAFFTSLLIYMNRLFSWLLFSKPKEIVDRGDRVFNLDCLFQQYVMEWAVPREKTAEVLLELKDWIETNQFPAHFPVEVRFVMADNIYLSPAYNMDSCYINILMFRPYNKYVPHETYWNAFQDIMLRAGGRPHWAKDHGVVADQFRKMYPKWTKFCEIAQKVDPHAMFRNPNLERVLGRN
ncbi:L-gulonolactone oxidase isoform X2 [Lingula anatina]|uniref:L-gulonolactone oxidase isoform X2 n=1 Tax=Lingula anatina TaxID=7574 RepID=A0A1S3I6R4_LINAN|nr:L-gulonolactone oxidase isoform X2 [Lingula anatina]|eukprot:XP_013393536.1 L-gulonolactone oxidase isoform X2 [Lingula anatina]